MFVRRYDRNPGYYITDNCSVNASATPTSSLQMKMERPLWDWKAAMSRLVMRSTTRTALVTKVIWSCSSPRNLITYNERKRGGKKKFIFHVLVDILGQ